MHNHKVYRCSIVNCPPSENDPGTVYNTAPVLLQHKCMSIVGFMQIGVNDGEGDDNEVEGVDGALRHRICER